MLALLGSLAVSLVTAAATVNCTESAVPSSHGGLQTLLNDVAASGADDPVACIPSGTYTVTTSLIIPSSMTIIGSDSAAPLISCSDTYCFDGSAGPSGVTLQNLSLSGAHKADIQIGTGSAGAPVSGWTLTGITAKAAGQVGIAMNKAANITISNALIDRNGSVPYNSQNPPSGDFGLRASRVDHLILQDSIISNNPITSSPMTGFAGGAKFNTNTNLLVQRNDFFGNGGGGQLWVDISSHDFNIVDNTIEHVANPGTGKFPQEAIRVEVSCAGTDGSFVQNNILTGGTLAAIDLFDSSGIVVRHNTVTVPAATMTTSYGIRMMGNAHGTVPDNGCQVAGSFPNRNNLVTDNDIDMSVNASADNGVKNSSGGVSTDNAWTQNTYTLQLCDPPSAPQFVWWDGANTQVVGYAGWQAFGQDTGSLSSCTSTHGPLMALTVTNSGGGTVTSLPPHPGIDCGTTCTHNFPQGSSVVLHAEPDPQSTFDGWTGGGCSGTGDCTVSMVAAQSVAASFNGTPRQLTVTRSGSGDGSVTSDPDGIDCPGTCAASYDAGTSVELTATPAPGSVFTGWSDDCSGTGTCTVTMDVARHVTARFAPAEQTLTVAPGGGGTGAVTSDVAGIDCGATCSADFAQGTAVVLTATPDEDMVFTGWSGDCTGTGTCDVTMDADRSIIATFEPALNLSVAFAGPGGGTVTTPPKNEINCPTTCAADFATNGLVTLHAVSDASSTFTGWSGNTGGGCVDTSDCVVTMDHARSITATFGLGWVLQVQGVGAGGGTITADSGAINCGGTCQDTYPNGTEVTLHAADGPNSTFSNWSGDTDGNCPGTADCVVTMTQARSIMAHYDPVSDTLTVTKSGTGAGTVTSLAPSLGIDCGTTCDFDFQQGTSVVLHAAADASSGFISWSGGGCSGTSDCTVLIDAAKTVNAQFDVGQRLLTVTKAGNGSGSVTSDVGAINCPGTCSDFYAQSTNVTLTAHLGANSVFTGWSGEGCAGTGTCMVTMDQARNVTATFVLVQHLLTLTKNGTGTGTVTSDVAGINCGANCSANYDHGQAVVLTATPAVNVAFAGWTGDCSGTGTCSVTMDASGNVTATFNNVPFSLTVTKAGNGNGSVTSDDAGNINCPGTCSASYTQGTGVTLTAHLGANSVFTGWSGEGCAGTGTCMVTMGQARNVTATFTLIRHQLSITKNGTGTGSVSSDVGGINCGVTCSANYDHGTAVVLTETPGANVIFAGWSGGVCTGLTTTCNVTMNADLGVTATFNKVQHVLSVTKAGTGTGQITSNVGGINCPGTCSASYDHGAAVVLTATPSGGSTFAGWSGGTCAGTGACNVTVDAAKAVTGTFNPPVATTTLRDNDTGVAYNGWFGVADGSANGGAYRMSNVKNDSASWKSPSTGSISWVTRTGPDQGKASVTIDGKNKGTVDLYSASPGALTKVYSGLAHTTHTIVIDVLLTKNAASSGFNVRLDAFVVNGATTQESDPAIQYDTWKSTNQGSATDGTYRSASGGSATVTVRFTGTGIDWITTMGKAYGKASVRIDGVSKGTVDLYRSTTAWRSLITFAGLTSGAHTMVIGVLHQKNGSATGTEVVVDGFIVHG